MASITMEPLLVLALSLGLMPLYCRVEKDKLLDHPRREMLYEAIRAQPGLSQSDLARRTGLAQGALTHHLRLLESQGLIRGVKDTLRVRYHLRGPRVELAPYLTQVQRRLMQAVTAHPGASQRELAHATGLSPHNVHYHLERLRHAGLVTKPRQGRRTAAQPLAGLAAAFTSAPVTDAAEVAA